MKTKVKEVINDPTFKGYGRLIFPVDIKIEDDLTLQNIEEILPWYSEINPKRTVEIINYMKNKVQNGNQIFFGEKAYPKPGAVIMQYTGLSEVTKHEIQIFDGLTHGLGEGTVAEGWINEAVRFWERQVK